MIAELAKCYVLLSKFQSKYPKTIIWLDGGWVGNHGISQDGSEVFPIGTDLRYYYTEPPYALDPYDVSKYRGTGMFSNDEDGETIEVVEGHVLSIAPSLAESGVEDLLYPSEEHEYRRRFARSHDYPSYDDPYETAPEWIATSPVQLAEYEWRGAHHRGWMVYFEFEGEFYPLPLSSRVRSRTRILGHIETSGITFGAEAFRARTFEEFRERLRGG